MSYFQRKAHLDPVVPTSIDERRGHKRAEAAPHLDACQFGANLVHRRAANAAPARGAAPETAEPHLKVQTRPSADKLTLGPARGRHGDCAGPDEVALVRLILVDDGPNIGLQKLLRDCDGEVERAAPADHGRSCEEIERPRRPRRDGNRDGAAASAETVDVLRRSPPPPLPRRGGGGGGGGFASRELCGGG